MMPEVPKWAVQATSCSNGFGVVYRHDNRAGRRLQRGLPRANVSLFGVEYSRYLDCLASDFARLRAVVPIDLAAPVPSCPGWTVADLTRHVGEVYLHKTLAMREGAEPVPWPP